MRSAAWMAARRSRREWTRASPPASARVRARSTVVRGPSRTPAPLHAAGVPSGGTDPLRMSVSRRWRSAPGSSPSWSTSMARTRRRVASASAWRLARYWARASSSQAGSRHGCSATWAPSSATRSAPAPEPRSMRARSSTPSNLSSSNRARSRCAQGEEVTSA